MDCARLNMSHGVHEDHAKACAEIGVTPDQSAWDRGRIQGLRLYCTPENAYSIGRNGDAVNNVCPASAVGVLTRANAWGQEYYGITGEIADLHDERDEIRALLATLTGELSDEQKALRRTYRERLLRLDGKLFDLERDRRRFGSLPQSLVADL